MATPSRGLLGSLRHSASARALAVVACVALAEVALLIAVAGARRDDAHIIDINGAQRMRSQRIAYLALAAHDGRPAAEWQPELRLTIAEILRVRSELLARHDLLPVPADPRTGETPTSAQIVRYAKAAAAIVRDPHDARAFSYIEAQREPLLDTINSTVKARANLLGRRHDELLAGLMAGLTVILVTIVTTWNSIVAPSERRTAELLRKLHDSEAQLRSLFSENPDAIAVYDLDGRVVRGNRASRELLGRRAKVLQGAHFRAHLVPSELSTVDKHFARALRGERVAFDTQFLGESGEPIDVAASLFPHVIEGRTVGVIGVAKDTRALRRAQAAYEAQVERITELYRVATFQNHKWKRHVEETLAVAAQRVGYDWALATETVRGQSTVIALVGDPGVDLGAKIALPTNERFDEFDEPGIAGYPINIGDERYGMVVVGSTRRKNRLEVADYDFLRLVTALVATSIQRGDHERRLDALAFYDVLTGLPNRVALTDRLVTKLEAAARAHESFAVLCLDLDGFKAVNDSYGHAAGDDVLRAAAERLRSCVRDTDTVARIGGDEFVIVAGLDHNRRGAAELAKRIIDVFGTPFTVDSSTAAVGVSIGISVFPDHGATSDDLLRTADAALYGAKRGGRNRLEFAA